MAKTQEQAGDLERSVLELSVCSDPPWCVAYLTRVGLDRVAPGARPPVAAVREIYTGSEAVRAAFQKLVEAIGREFVAHSSSLSPEQVQVVKVDARH